MLNIEAKIYTRNVRDQGIDIRIILGRILKEPSFRVFWIKGIVSNGWSIARNLLIPQKMLIFSFSASQNGL